MNWIGYTLLSIACFTIYDLLSKKISIESKNQNILAATYNAILGFFSLLFFILTYFQNPTNITKELIPTIILASISWGVFGKFEYIARQKTELSTFLIIIKFAPMITILSSLLLFHEPTSPKIIISFLLVIVAGLIVQKISRNKSDLRFIIIATIAIGVAWSFDNQLTSYINPGLYSLAVSVISVISNLIFPTISIKQVLSEVPQLQMKNITILAFVNSIGYIAMLYAYKTGNAGTITVLSTTAAMFAIALSIIVFNERENLLQKGMATLLTIVASLILII